MADLELLKDHIAFWEEVRGKEVYQLTEDDLKGLSAFAEFMREILKEQERQSPEV